MAPRSHSRFKTLSLANEYKPNEASLTFTTSSPSTIFNFSRFSCSSWGFIRHFSKPSRPTEIESRQAELQRTVHSRTSLGLPIHTCAHTHTTYTRDSRWFHYRSGWALWSTPGWEWRTHPGSWQRAPRHCWSYDSGWRSCSPRSSDKKEESGKHWRPPSSCCPPGNNTWVTSPSQGYIHPSDTELAATRLHIVKCGGSEIVRNITREATNTSWEGRAIFPKNRQETKVTPMGKGLIDRLKALIFINGKKKLKIPK